MRSSWRPVRSTSSSSSATWTRRAGCAAPGTCGAPRTRCAPRSRCSAGRRWPTSSCSGARRRRARGWTSLRLAALEDRLELDLALGEHAAAIPELEALVAQHPYREQLHAHLMLALYRAGRQADALDAFRRARRVLVEELGLEPGPELQRLEAAVLAQDPALELGGAGARARRAARLPRAPRAPRRPGRPRSGARRGRRAAARPGRAPGDRSRAGRCRQDAARDRAGPPARGRVPRRRALRPARRDRHARAAGAGAGRSRTPAPSCCSCSTTSSSWWTPRRSWSDLLARAPGVTVAGHEPGGAAPVRRARGAARAARRRSGGRAVRPPRPRARRRPTRRSPRSARGSTACRWRSSWRPRARGCSHPPRSSSGSGGGSTC